MIDAQRTQLYHLIDPTDSVFPEMPRERGGKRKRGKWDLQTEMAFLQWKMESPEMSGGRDYRRTGIERLPEGDDGSLLNVDGFFLLSSREGNIKRRLKKSGKKKKKKGKKILKKKSKKSGLK